MTAKSGLSRYLWKIQRFPVLEPHEECVPAKRWREHGDHEAAHKRVNSHLRFVAKIARGYRGYGLPVSDLISEGNVGLVGAIQRFDPEKGFPLATYAMWWIRASIGQYVLRSWSLVNMAKKLFLNLRATKSKISVFDNGDIRYDRVKTIAKRLGVTEREVTDMKGWLSGDAALNSPRGQRFRRMVGLAGGRGSQPGDYPCRERRKPPRGARLGALRAQHRERRIFEARMLAEESITLAELAGEFGVSRERVRQIDANSFKKVEKALKNRIAAIETLAPVHKL